LIWDHWRKFKIQKVPNSFSVAVGNETERDRGNTSRLHTILKLRNLMCRVYEEYLTEWTGANTGY